MEKKASTNKVGYQLAIPLITSQEQPWLGAGAPLLMCPEPMDSHG